MRARNIVIKIIAILYTFFWIVAPIIAIVIYNQNQNVSEDPLGTYMVHASYASVVLISFAGLFSAVLLMLSVFTYYSHNKSTSIYKKKPLVFSSIANLLIFPVLFLLFQNNNAFVVLSLLISIIWITNIIICAIFLILYIIND